MPNYSINIVTSEKITVQEDNSQMLSVQFQILNGNMVDHAITEEEKNLGYYPDKQVGDVIQAPEVETTLRHGYALDTSMEDIVADLEQVLETYLRDIALGEKGAAIEAANAKADETMTALKGLTVNRKKSI